MDVILYLRNLLCNALPYIRSETPTLSTEGYDAFAKMIKTPLARVNSLLPQSER